MSLLYVEDDPISAGAVAQALADGPHRLRTLPDAEAAWRHLQVESGYDAVLLDWQLPGMDGLSLLQRMQAEPTLRAVPVIMVTSRRDPAFLRQGLEAGAYHYLSKPVAAPLLRAVVDGAVAESRRRRELHADLGHVSGSLDLMVEGRFRFRTLPQAMQLARGLARCFAEPERAASGLWELMVNAVEHGNLGIGYGEKTRLLLEGRWEEALQQRLQDPVLGRREAVVTLVRGGGQTQLTLQDEGAGFDWQDYLDFDPGRAFDPHGRGIAMARRLGFDRLSFLGNGSTVVVTAREPTRSERPA